MANGSWLATINYAMSRSYLWDLLEKPWSSAAAQWYAVASMLVVVLSTLTFVFSTLESEGEEDSHPALLLVLEVIGAAPSRRSLSSNIYFTTADVSCVVIFSLEYAVRFFCAPQKFTFFRDPMNLGERK